MLPNATSLLQPMDLRNEGQTIQAIIGINLMTWKDPDYKVIEDINFETTIPVHKVSNYCKVKNLDFKIFKILDKAQYSSILFESFGQAF